MEIDGIPQVTRIILDRFLELSSEGIEALPEEFCREFAAAVIVSPWFIFHEEAVRRQGYSDGWTDAMNHMEGNHE